MIRILLVDDHPILRHGTQALLDAQHDFCVVAATGSPGEAPQLAVRERVDVALVDLDLGPNQENGAAVTRRILRARPEARVIAFTAFDADADIVQMVDAGAAGYLVKDIRPEILLSTIRQAASGANALSGPIAERLDERQRQPMTALTARELEVLELAAAGLGNRQLAQELLVSEATVKTHLHHAFTKLGVKNRQTAIATAVQQGLIRINHSGA